MLSFKALGVTPVFLFKASIPYNVRVHAAYNLYCTKLLQFVFPSKLAAK